MHASSMFIVSYVFVHNHYKCILEGVFLSLDLKILKFLEFLINNFLLIRGFARVKI